MKSYVNCCEFQRLIVLKSVQRKNLTPNNRYAVMR